MALLRLTSGRVYTAPEDINRIVSPMQVGEFAIAPEVRTRIRAFKHPLSQEDAMYVLKNLDPKVIAMAEKDGFRYRRVGNVVPSAADDGNFTYMQRFEDRSIQSAPQPMSAEAVRDYLIPHYVKVNDWHCIFSGAIIKGVQLRDGQQGVVYCEAGDWIRLSPKVLNWPIFPYGEATAAVSMFDQPCEGNFDMELHSEVKIQSEMRY
jgi:hypothetical protein